MPGTWAKQTTSSGSIEAFILRRRKKLLVSEHFQLIFRTGKGIWNIKYWLKEIDMVSLLDLLLYNFHHLAS
jgi:hypothetical protein